MRTLLISDVHIGFKFSRAKDAVSVLENVKFDRLILVGDIFDIQNMMHRPYWDEYHTAFLKKILKIAKKKEVIYVIGQPRLSIVSSTGVYRQDSRHQTLP
jgi:UDP-2,3-diacylglucosamine pyrophosphatase LpxH